ncbi:MAG: KDO2-lipid IV(A) lauroyltransferase [Gammaproteobacteria bacterium]|jgi:KDO2-lipid IV(A) lauroyltransferase
MSKMPRYFLEFVAFSCALMCVRVLPLSFTEWLAHRAGDLWYLCGRRRRLTARTNIRRAGIADDDREVERIARASFRHFMLVLLETFKSTFMLTPQMWRERTTVDIPQDVQQVLDDSQQGLILASAHLGNWEVAAHAVSQMKPVTGITRVMNNPFVERLIQKYKPRDGFTLTPKNDANNSRLINVLKRGEILAVMVDQSAGRRGMMVDFFDHPASTHTSAALLHLVTGAPLCFGYCTRAGPMSFHVTATPLIRVKPTGDKQRDVRFILEQLNRHIEAAIRKAPEQYNWAHRRWREKTPISSHQPSTDSAVSRTPDAP